eukprot:Colp12_sorted_trinity150504_noHs@20595
MLDHSGFEKPHTKQKKWRPVAMNSKEKRESQVFKLSKDNQKYEIYEPLRQLWLQYMKTALGLPGSANPKTCGERLLKADLHGCNVTVTRSKCPSYVGLHGTILQETEQTFNIITKEDRLLCIPKANSIFTFAIEGLVFTLHGNHFCFRSGERAARKFKPKPTIDL